VEDARELRKLAEWYRAFAEVGRSEHREGRLQLADYLERRARELEADTLPKPDGLTWVSRSGFGANGGLCKNGTDSIGTSDL
jgi:hypothetical protein